MQNLYLPKMVIKRTDSVTHVPYVTAGSVNLPAPKVAGGGRRGSSPDEVAGIAPDRGGRSSTSPD